MMGRGVERANKIKSCNHIAIVACIVSNWSQPIWNPVALLDDALPLYEGEVRKLLVGTKSEISMLSSTTHDHKTIVMLKGN